MLPAHPSPDLLPLLEVALNSVADPLFIVMPDGRREFCNPAGEELSAAPDFAGGWPAVLDVPLREVLATGLPFLPNADDHPLTFRLGLEDRQFLPRIRAVADQPPGCGGAVVILKEVTRLRLLEEVKGNLVGTVSHELKTPLTSLRMAIYLLLEKNLGGLTADQRELLETAREEADRLLCSLNNLLDLAR